MDGGMLSQEEINALLSGMDGDTDSGGSAAQPELTEIEKDAIGEISNISMGTAATTLSTLVNRKVVITTPVVSYATIGDLSASFDRPCVFIQISYKEGLDGKNVLILRENDVKIITDLMMGGDGTNLADELSELHLSAISEAMNQMMGSAATSISSMLERKVDISPPVASLIDLNETISGNELYSFLDGEFIQVSFKMEIGELVDSQIIQLYPFDFARELYRKFSNNVMPDYDTATGVNQSAAQPVSQSAAPDNMGMPNMDMQNAGMAMQQPMMQQPNMGMPNMGMPNMGMPMQQPMMQQPNMGMPMYAMPPQDVNVQPAQFQAFSANISPLTQQENIDLIMDVPLEVTVELGRTNKSIKEILDFSPGTIIELNKLAGEPIDVLVNGKYVAKGEVVVIEDSFGIRVTEIIR